MYSFSQRNDIKILDEPLYAYWLAQNPSVFRPYREELVSSHNTDGNAVLSSMLAEKSEKIVFAKHIAKQAVGLDRKFLYDKRCRHVFLVRDPLEMIASWEVKSEIHHEECTLSTMSLPFMCELFSDIRQKTGICPLVVDSTILKTKPRDTLMQLSSSLGIDYCEDQLSWIAGSKPDIDGYVCC
jgi:hypothetical protein